MRATELDLRRLVELTPDGESLLAAGAPALLLDREALASLGETFSTSLGPSGAAAILSRLGLAFGGSTAARLRTAFEWDSASEWANAGTSFLRACGIATPTPGSEADLRAVTWARCAESESAPVEPASEGNLWVGCHFVRSFLSGYWSAVDGQDVLCVEERCRRRGDPACRMVGRRVTDWPAEVRELAALHQEQGLPESLGRLRTTLRTAEQRLNARRRALARLEIDEQEGGVVAVSQALRQVVNVAARAALVDAPVLLVGELGTGKRTIASFIHERSAREARPLRIVSCAGKPESILGAELFGADGVAGALEASHGGTVVIDEIAELPLALQADLARWLDSGLLLRAGAEPRRVDVRVIITSRQDPEVEAAAGHLSADLRHRIQVVQLKLPPLRERRDDILPLARVFLLDANRRAGRPEARFTPRAAHQLVRHSWPGNVRELKNAIESAALVARGDEVELEDLPEQTRIDTLEHVRRRRSEPLAEVERRHILDVLEAAGGNRAIAARILDIGPATLYRKLAQYREEEGSGAAAGGTAT